MKKKRSCSSRCWFAKKNKCDCICGGVNHQKSLFASYSIEREGKLEKIGSNVLPTDDFRPRRGGLPSSLTPGGEVKSVREAI